jgi:YVTN family beta-propeller protein
VNSGADSVAVVDLQAKKEVRLIPVGSEPVAIALLPDGSKAYVVNKGSNNVSVISTTTFTEKKIPVDTMPTAIVVTPNGQRVYVTNSAGKSLAIIDPLDDSVEIKTLAVTRTSPTQLVVSPDSKTLYVFGEGDSFVEVVNVETSKIGAVQTGLNPVSIAFSPDGREAYVANKGANTLSVLTTTTFPPSKVTADVMSSVGTGPQSVVVSTETGKVYVGFASGAVSVLEPANAVGSASITVSALERELRAALGPIVEKPEIPNGGCPDAKTSQNREGTRGGASCNGQKPDYRPIYPPANQPPVSSPTGPSPGPAASNPDPNKQCEGVTANAGSNTLSTVDTCGNGGNNSNPITVGQNPTAPQIEVQSPPVSCTTAVSGPTNPVSSGGTVAVTAGSCRWGARSLAAWIKLIGRPFPNVAFGQGTVDLVFTVEPNPGAAERTGVILMEAREVSIRQAAGGSVTVRRPLGTDGGGPQVKPKREPGSTDPGLPIVPRR